MINPEIEKAIQVIEAKIEELQKARKVLIDLFGSTVNLAATISAQNQTSRPKLTLSKPSRRDALIRLFEEQGPLSRSEIFKQSGFPKGTVAYLLNDKDTFVSKNGRWHLVKNGGSEESQKEKGLTSSE